MIIDLRSDTVTQPTTGMMEAMRTARVGDDVFEEDPTVIELEQLAASIFGMEAALYCPTGTMSNQIGIKVHTQPGDEIICERNSHVYQYEGGGIAVNAGCQVNLIDGQFGKITAEQVEAAINNPDDVHKAISRLVSLENTVNRGGGGCYDFTAIEKIREVCNKHQLKLHLDGARLFNALVATGQDARDYGKTFDSISICLNKGLGCPIGSVLIGSSDFIRRSRRVRKVFGGGMRQAGYMAATGVYALKNHVTRLSEDHHHAKLLSGEIIRKKFCKQLLPVQTNIVIFETTADYLAKEVIEMYRAHDIRIISMGPRLVRFVFHLDITPAMVEKVLSVTREL